MLTTLRWAVPAARAILAVTLPEPARTQVGRALDAVVDAGVDRDYAIEVYAALADAGFRVI